MFLGVKSKLNRGSRGGSKDFGAIMFDNNSSINSNAVAHGNTSMQLAWNTTGFLPNTIGSSAGQAKPKNSVKDFEYLKFVNDTILKDDVLNKFMQKAGEIEIAAGPK